MEDSEFNYSASEMPCKKHPSSSSVGVCPFCLKDKLVNLICSECGEQRLSSCSCSDASSSYRNSCSTMEIGSVGRVSFLLENEKMSDFPQNVNPNLKKMRKEGNSEQVIFLRRSSSSCVEVKKSNGFWKIKRLFRKKRKGFGEKGEFCDEKSEIWVSDIMGVSRSRSLCSFRGGGRSDLDEDGFSSAKISDVTSGIFIDSEGRKSGFNGENEVDFSRGKRVFGQNDRIYGVQNRGGVFPAKESDFSAMDESNFIDLKLDLSSESRHEFCGGRTSGASDNGFGFKSESFGSLKNKGLFGNSGSCRIGVNERGLNRGTKSHKVWKWIFKYHPTGKKKE